MKRVGHLWDAMISFPALFHASRMARRRKKSRSDVAEFEFQLESELWRLHEELRTRTYRPGEYHSFRIYEPKERLVSAAPYRDRVVHHALVGVLEEIFEPGFIHHSYACRKGRGSHAAMRTAQRFARRFPYVLKADVRQFFPSIDHQILVQLLQRRIADPHVLWLVRQILDGRGIPESDPVWFPGDSLLTPLERPRGLPIGNQTSQFFANVYLNPLDHFVCHLPAVCGYVRYADDLLVFGRDKESLHVVHQQIRRFLQTLRLRLHPGKSQVFPVRCGIPFVGFRVFPSRCLLQRAAVRRFQRRMKHVQLQFQRGEVDLQEVRARIVSWCGHAQQGSAAKWRDQLLSRILFTRGVSR